MAQKRMIDKKISVSEQVNNMPLEAQLIFTWMIPHADDVGLLPRSHRTIKAIVIPLVEMTMDRFDELMEAIKTQDLIEIFSYNGQEFYRLKQFFRFQILKKDRNPQTILNYKAGCNPQKNWNLLTKLFGFQMEDNGFQMDTEVKRSKEKIREGKLSEDRCVHPPTDKKFKKPTLSEVQDYCKEIKADFDCQRFVDFYESKGWVVGRAPMRDWKSAVRNWNRGGSYGTDKKNNVGNSGGTGRVHAEAEKYEKFS